MVPISDGTTRNILTHYGQVSIENTRTHATTYINTPTRDAQDNDMFYYFLEDSITNEFRTTVLLYTAVYTISNIPVASSLLKQIIILTMVDNPASMMHIREMLIEYKHKLLLLKGNITEFNQWVRKQMGHLHAWEQEAVDLLYYLWKAYKATPDEEFVVYIKDLKSQCNDGRATFTMEDLMVQVENKYDACLLDEENAWGKPTEEQQKIIAMSAEINSLKKECGSSSGKTNKPKQAAKKQAPKKAATKKPADKKKRASDKWAWKNKPPKESEPKENEAFVKTFENKKYYSCKNHNNGAGMWALHDPNDCESSSGSNHSVPNADLAAFDTMDSDSDQECLLCQGQGFPWFWLTLCYDHFWLLFLDDMGMMIAAFFLMTSLLFILMLECISPEEMHPYVPKRLRPPKNLWTKLMLKAMDCCTTPLVKMITI